MDIFWIELPAAAAAAAASMRPITIKLARRLKEGEPLISKFDWPGPRGKNNNFLLCASYTKRKCTFFAVDLSNREALVLWRLSSTPTKTAPDSKWREEIAEVLRHHSLLDDELIEFRSSSLKISLAFPKCNGIELRSS